jgi:Ni/Co efflux regulator RcnB
MKKFMMGAMTGLLLASAAAPALAQDGRWSGGGGDQGGGQGRAGGWSNRNAAPQAQAPAPAQGQAPVQAAPAAPVPHNRSGQAVRSLERGDRGAWNGQPAGDANRSGRDWNRDGRAGAVDQNRNGDQNRARNWDQNRGSGQVQNRNWDQTRGSGQVENRNGDQNRGRDWDRNRNGADARNWNGDRNWSGGRGDRDRPRYDRRYYPPVYHAQNRYRGGSYRPPYGFYDRTWAYGDILPRGWFGSSYYIDEWSDYGLPVPPVGYEWTRVGDDGVLVDTYTGRIVQVVYDLFW